MDLERKHGLIAALMLLVFAGLLGYSYRWELLPLAMRLAQPILSLRAETRYSSHFEVRNRSSADAGQVERMIERLEEGYADISQFLRRPRTTPIVVDLADGAAPAFSEGEVLHVFCDQGYINLELANFWLVGLIASQSSRPFLDVGLAVYTLEETGHPLMQITQEADAWVTLLMQKQALLPLAEAWELSLTGEVDQVFLFQAALEAGSFVRWVVETYGWEVYWDLHRSGDPDSTLGQPLAGAEAAWLAGVAARRLSPKPCLLATPSNAMFRELCQELDRESMR